MSDVEEKGYEETRTCVVARQVLHRPEAKPAGFQLYPRANAQLLPPSVWLTSPASA